MNKASLQNGRGVILDRSAKFVHSGNLTIGQCLSILLLSWETVGFGRTHAFQIDSRPSPSYEILELTIGTFDGLSQRLDFIISFTCQRTI